MALTRLNDSQLGQKSRSELQAIFMQVDALLKGSALSLTEQGLWDGYKAKVKKILDEKFSRDKGIRPVATQTARPVVQPTVNSAVVNNAFDVLTEMKKNGEIISSRGRKK
jgi:hypothetical protein